MIQVRRQFKISMKTHSAVTLQSVQDLEVSDRLFLAPQVSVVIFLGIWCNVWKPSCSQAGWISVSLWLCVCVYVSLPTQFSQRWLCHYSIQGVRALSLSFTHTHMQCWGLSPFLSCSLSVMHCVLTPHSSDVIWEWIDGWRWLMRKTHTCVSTHTQTHTHIEVCWGVNNKLWVFNA